MNNIVRHLMGDLGAGLILACALVPAISFSQSSDPTNLKAPETIEEAKEGILNIGDKVAEGIPGIVASIWEDEILPLAKKMATFAKEEIWERRLKPLGARLRQEIGNLLGEEVEKRKPLIEEELEQEKQEVKEEFKEQAGEAGKGLWERFRGLFREE